MAWGLETLARPYAKAAFSVALETGELEVWSAWLNHLAQVANHPQIQALMANPTVTLSQRNQLLKDINKVLPPLTQAENFIQLVVQKRRFNLLPIIAHLFEAMKQQQASKLPVELTAAWELDNEQKTKLADALNTRLKQTIMLHCAIDKSLLGGVIIRIGNTVIDHSIRGRLARLKGALAR